MNGIFAIFIFSSGILLPYARFSEFACISFESIYPKLCWFESLFMLAVANYIFNSGLVDTFYVCLVLSSRLWYSFSSCTFLAVSMSLWVHCIRENDFTRASLVKPFSTVSADPSSHGIFVHTVRYFFSLQCNSCKHWYNTTLPFHSL